MSYGCEVAVELSTKARRWISRQDAVGEESLTDWLLYELSDRLPWVHYLKFSRHQEARSTGADWDWWFVGDRGSVALRVQAKRLRYNEDCYKGLAHTNRHGLQIEKLIESSTSHNLLPMYALYSALDQEVDLLCGGRLQARDEDGIFVSGAIELYDGFIAPGRGRVNAEDVLRLSNPFSCVFCCPMAPVASFTGGGHPAGPGGPDDPGPTGWFRRYFRATYDGMLDRLHESNTRQERSPGFHKEPVPAVATVLKGIEKGLPDWYEQEFSRYLEGTNSLLIFDVSGVDGDHLHEP